MKKLFNTFYFAAMLIGIISNWAFAQLPFEPFVAYPGNPVVTSSPGEWDQGAVFSPNVVFINDTFYLTYSGTSLFPTIPPSTGLAVSSDGFTFFKSSSNPILSGDGSGFDAYSAAGGVILYDNSVWYIYYTGLSTGPSQPGNVIGRATTNIGPHGPWTRNNDTLLTVGSAGEWDSEYIAPTCIVENGAELVMYYWAGSSWPGPSQIGMATSTNGGTIWQKYNDPATIAPPYAESDPVLKPDKPYDYVSISPGNVIIKDNGWEMFYGGLNGDSASICYAISLDGIMWVKDDTYNPIFTPSQDPYAINGLTTPAVVLYNNKYFMYYDYNVIPTGIGLATSLVVPNNFQLTVSILDGWNMVSVPGLHPTDQNVNTWWQYRDQSANVFKYASGYQQVVAATPGEGYWMKHLGDRTYNTGDEWPAGGIQNVPNDPIPGALGWNLIGGYETSVAASSLTSNPPGLIIFPVYKYSGGYQVATTVDPGYGYWIKLTGAGQIIIPETMVKGEVVEYFPEDWGKIIMTDASGINYTLYAVKGEVDLNQYELPPAPPVGMFDIRFSSGRIAEDLSNTQSIELSGIVYPVTINVENMNITLQDESGKQINVELKTGVQVTIHNKSINKLLVLSNEMITPIEYALEQNYPNPFNPTTTIGFSIQNKSNVKITILNAIGEELAVILNEDREAGFHQVEFNAIGLPSGVYFYQLKAIHIDGQSGSFVETKKMILLK